METVSEACHVCHRGLSDSEEAARLPTTARTVDRERSSSRSTSSSGAAAPTAATMEPPEQPACSAVPRMPRHVQQHGTGERAYVAIERGLAAMRRRLEAEGQLPPPLPQAHTAAAAAAVADDDAAAGADAGGVDGGVAQSLEDAAAALIANGRGSDSLLKAAGDAARSAVTMSSSVQPAAAGQHQLRVAEAKSQPPPRRQGKQRQRRHHELPPAPLEPPGNLSESNWASPDVFPRGFPLPRHFAALVRARAAASERASRRQRSLQAAALVHAASAQPNG